MDKLLVRSLRVKGLWGHRHYNIRFNPDINIIIGPNASGKTTLINILHHALTANFAALAQLVFKEINVQLDAFDGTAESTVNITQTDESLVFVFEGSEISMPLAIWRVSPDSPDLSSHSYRRALGSSLHELRFKLVNRVPAVWLPVSRRLPISDEEDADRRRLHRRPLESVDECLAELLENLQRYRISLDSHLSELRKDFQKHAFEVILYDKQHDRADWSQFTSPTEEDRTQLRNAFSELGLFDTRIKKRIDEHFAAAQRAAEKLQLNEPTIDLDTLFIVPLMNRTTSMVQFAQELERRRTELFAALHSYEEIVSSFLVHKHVTVDGRGRLEIASEDHGSERLEWRHLSSGEKQILILLTQAILSERDPVVYVADEPELSLHVTWQEKLLGSLSKLAGLCQFIVATHSPDIAGGFPNNIIDLGRR